MFNSNARNYLTLSKQMINIRIISVNNTWCHLTVCKEMNSGSSKMFTKNYSLTNCLFV